MARSRESAFFGHPIGLSTLFFTEMWERASYYGIRALLILFMTAAPAAGGRGMTPTAAGTVMALYLSSVYLLSLPGGWIADRFLGQRNATAFGGIGIAAGNALLALPIEAGFYPGLVLIAIGTGLLKPNISTMVGQLYAHDDPRRDGGYTIYYMGINIGAFLAPLGCGYFAQSAGFRAFLIGHGVDPNWGWHFGFAAASIGMIIGVIQYLSMQGWLSEASRHPTVPTDPARAARDRTVLAAIVIGLIAVGAVFAFAGIDAETIVNVFGVGLAILAVLLFTGLMRSLSPSERKKMTAVIVLFLGSIAFFGIFEQASTTLSLFAENFTERRFLGFDFPASYYQSVNSVFIILLAPLFAAIWVKLGKAGREPTSVVKF
ncbi:MAG TPA: oligopeptide:H+ symporter, partial [Kofleriaceae bacterium]